MIAQNEMETGYHQRFNNQPIPAYVSMKCIRSHIWPFEYEKMAISEKFIDTTD